MTGPIRTRARLAGGTLLLLLVALVALATLPSSATAKTRAGVALFAGFNNYTMTDVNSTFILPVNEFLVPVGFVLKDITSGWGVGTGLRVRPAHPILLSFDYERLFARSDLTIFMENYVIDTPANALTATATYYFPSSSKSRFGVGAGVGYYRSAGSVEIDTLGVANHNELDGSGVGFHGLVSFDAEISPNVHFEGNAGLRYAKTTDVKVEGEEVLNPAGDKAKIDWTGFMSRAGLTFYFGVN